MSQRAAFPERVVTASGERVRLNPVATPFWQRWWIRGLVAVLIFDAVWLWFIVDPADPYAVRLQHVQGVNDVASHSDAGLLATASDDRIIRLWDLYGRPQSQIVGHSDRVTAVEFSPLADQLIGGTGKGEIRLWDLATGIEIRTLQGHRGSVTALLWNDANQEVYSVAWDKKLLIHGLRDSSTKVVPLPAVCESMVLTEGSSLLLGCHDGEVRQYSVTSGRVSGFLSGHEGAVKAVRLSSDGETLLTCGADGTVRRWSVTSRKQLSSFTHTSPVTDVVFTSDDRFIVAGTKAGHVHVYDVTNSQHLVNSRSPLQNIQALAVIDNCVVAVGRVALGVIFEATAIVEQ